MRRDKALSSDAHRRRRLLAGDLMCFLLATLIGFATHQELELATGDRFLATLLPFSAAWLLVAPAMGAYGGLPGPRWVRLGRAAWAAAVSAPLGAWLRAAVLDGVVLPLFILIMAAVTSGLVLAWRLAEELVFGPR